MQQTQRNGDIFDKLTSRTATSSPLSSNPFPFFLPSFLPFLLSLLHSFLLLLLNFSLLSFLLFSSLFSFFYFILFKLLFLFRFLSIFKNYTFSCIWHVCTSYRCLGKKNKISTDRARTDVLTCKVIITWKREKEIKVCLTGRFFHLFFTYSIIHLKSD